MIFVVGNSRSGTTMMGRVLGGHPEVFTFGELHFFEQLWSPEDRKRRVEKDEAMGMAARLLCIQRDGYLIQGDTARFHEEAKEVISSASPGVSTLADVFRAFLSYEASKNGKKIPCDQTPRNVFYIGDILQLYPEAQVLNMVRDPRDVLLSQKRKWRTRFLGDKYIPLKEAFRSWINYHPVTISKLWNGSISAADRFGDHGRVYSLRFEDLLADPEKSVRKVCEFIDVSFDEAMLKVPQIGSSSEVYQPDRKGIKQDRARSWRKGGLSPTEIFLCQKMTSVLAERHGYDLSPVRPDPLRLAWSVVSFPVKLVLALLFNLRRTRNLRETIKRRLQ